MCERNRKSYFLVDNKIDAHTCAATATYTQWQHRQIDTEKNLMFVYHCKLCLQNITKSNMYISHWNGNNVYGEYGAGITEAYEWTRAAITRILDEMLSTV